MICCNVNGLFFDNNRRLISLEEAQKLVKEHEDAFVKPTLASGGGKGVAIICDEEPAEVFNKFKINIFNGGSNDENATKVTQILRQARAARCAACPCQRCRQHRRIRTAVCGLQPWAKNAVHTAVYGDDGRICVKVCADFGKKDILRKGKKCAIIHE